MKKIFSSESAFFNPRALIGALLCFAGVTLAFFAFRTASAQSRTPSGQSGNSQPIVQAQYRGVLQVVKFDISPPLRSITPLPWKECTKSENEEGGPIPLGPVGPVVPDPVVQRLVGSIGIQIPGPIVSFDGNSNLCGCSPPDPNGEVGPNHVVTMANLHFQIFNKTGTSLFGPAANNTLWSGFGGGCQTQNSGDPVVLYDQLADRWLLTQFTASAPYLECVALSQTNDPTGAYYRWAIATGGGNNFPDYPKAGMWPDAYYFSTREFAGGSTFVGVGAYALDRAQALVGNPNPIVISFLAPPSPAYVVGDGLLPSDLDGMTPPPAGSPNFFVGSEDNNGPYGAPQDALTLWKFHADFGTPQNSTFTLTNTLPTAPFNSILGLCGGGRACIPQPGTTNKIDHLGYRQRPLHRLAYRNFGGHESLVTNQSVSAGTGPNGEVSGIRWWELRSPNSSPVIFQEGTYAPGLTDGIHRWMGSIAMDGAGNMALGYSASNGTVFPSVFYTGRLAGDPLGTMPQGEGSIKNGTGSQTGSNRWGDYTAISVDPTDDSTFWYVNEYVPVTSSVGWRLRIGSFKFPSVPACVPGPWHTSTTGPAIRYRAGGTTDGTYVYVYGGSNATAQYLNDLWRWDPTTETWTQLANMPTGKSNIQGTYWNGKIYVPGGYIGSHITENAIYDIATNTWTTGAPLPAAQSGQTVAYNNKIYNFGGNPGPQTTTSIYDIATNTWSTGAPMPVATTYARATVAGNFAYYVGGITTVTTNAVYRYDFAGNSWATMNPLQTARTSEELMTSPDGGKLFAVMGGDATFFTGVPLAQSVEIYNIAANSWSYGAPVVTKAAAPSGGLAGGKAMVQGGVDNTTYYNTVQVSPLICGPVPLSAVSRKVHGAAGTFDVNLPVVAIGGAVGIEDRTGAVAGAHQEVITFASPVTVSGVAVTSGTGSATFSVAGAVVTVNLTGVTDAQRLGVTLMNVNDGTTAGDVLIPMGVLSGDTNANGSVNAGDAAQTKGQSGQPVGAGNFREDVNSNGSINAGDVAIVKGKAGSVLPP